MGYEMRDTRKLFYMHFIIIKTFTISLLLFRFRLTKNTGRHLLPKVYINPNDFLPEPLYSGKIKVKYLVTACVHVFRSRAQLYSSILGFH